MKLSTYLRKDLLKKKLQCRPGTIDIISIIEQAANKGAELNPNQKGIVSDAVFHAQVMLNHKPYCDWDEISAGLQIAKYINSCH